MGEHWTRGAGMDGEVPKGWRVLVTGATGRIGFPIAAALARGSTVYGLARCRRRDDVTVLRRAGIEPVVGDLASLDYSALPSGLTHVFHAGARIGPEARNDWGLTFEINAQAVGRLMAATRPSEGFVLCSSGSVYEYQGQRPLREDDPPGVHLGIYSLSKIAAEAVARFACLDHEVPTAIIRVFSTYGPRGGAPADRLERILQDKEVVLHPDAPNRYNPIYEDDYVRLGVRALEVASVPALTVNWAGSETVSAEEYCSYLAQLAGREVRFRYDDRAPWPLWPDVSLMHERLGRTVVPWQQGMAEMFRARIELSA